MFLQEREGGLQRPCIAACGNVFWWPFRPTRANRHASVGEAQPAPSANAWRLACFGQFGCQKQLVMMIEWQCFVVVVCLSYDTQVVDYNVRTTPKPCGTFPRFFATMKWSPVDIMHMWIKRFEIQGFTCAYRGAGRRKLSYLGGKVSIFITLVHTNLLDNLSSFKVRYLCTRSCEAEIA